MSPVPHAAAGIDGRLQVVAVVVTALIFLFVLELVRRRRLAERYALTWMLVTGALLVLAIWTDLLSWGTELLNIEVPANGLFLAAFAVAFLLLLHFSVATSRLSEQAKILAQEVARLDGELREARANGLASDRRPGAPEQPQDDPPVPAEESSQQPGAAGGAEVG